MMYIREMRMLVGHRRVHVVVGMGLAIVVGAIVFVLVMCVVTMDVTVPDRLVRVFVFMLFREVQPNAPCHQRARQPERGAD